MRKLSYIFICSIILYSCSPINKQHGYLIDDVLLSSDKMADFSIGKTSKNNIYEVMGSPSIQIKDINDVWIYLISLKEKNVFEEDRLIFQSIFRFEFDSDGLLIKRDVLNEDDYKKIAFSTDKTKVRRDAYGITDQLYDAFTRGQ